MKKAALTLALSLFFTFSLPAYAVESFAPIVDKALPAVVNISTTQKVPARGIPLFPDMPDLETDRQQELEQFLERFGFPPRQGMEGEEQEVHSLGSGFVIDPEGYIVTNNHVIAQATEIVVTFANDKKLIATVIGKDPKTDLALLKVESNRALPYVEFGDSDGMRVGDWVIAIGNPFGLGSTVTAGIISARSRNINAGPFDDFLQTDAAINRGNSGGPMFNQEGEVIGVNTAIFSPSGGSVGIGFAIPTALAKPVLDQLRQYGKAHRGWLGVKIQHVTDEVASSLGLPRAMGALVLDISKDSPALKAGVQNGDVITSFDGHDIKEMRFLPRIVAETPIGKNITLHVWRAGKTLPLTLVLGEYPEEEEQAQEGSTLPDALSTKGELLLGMKLTTLNASRAATIRGAKSLKGVLVVEVAPASEAAKRALRAGDIILGVNQENIVSLDELKAEIGKARSAKRDYVLVRVWRAGESSYVTLPVNE